ncbi:dephospho-CoA kinase [Amycolatopsis thermophila]|uniref:Dephospho-CoA kinase n=1 Tax=Amycolatopsis thermophila TaxID=206084 RepID=A0ABU0F3U2_9PSEU|nr:dephospho-CoA kinase [Amycolatopsis thermophila]MDQ0382245.1 dephospho-CoA kinase [Amycolatopsis thermophila]
MLRVGLSGGIGAGKSTVAARLVEHGAVHVDADAIAREVVEPGTEGLAKVVEAFGADVLGADGALNRPALAAKAFADEESRQRLNGILHPLIGARTAERIAAAPPDAVVLHDVPLLVEGGYAPNYHLVLIVDAPVETRLRRLTELRGMSEEDARARIKAQASDEQRRAVADVWLDNSGEPDAVLAEVDRLWAERLVPFEANVRLRRPRPPVPPKLVPYDETWPAQAARALARLRLLTAGRALRVDHIGSTSVPGLPAKDVLDLQVTVSTLEQADEFADVLSDAGFLRAEGEWWDDPQGGGERWLKRFHYGADPGRAVNVHVRSTATPAWRLALLFAAWLRANPGERDAYAAVKAKLAQAHADDGSVEAYAEEKQGWVNAAFERAEEWAGRTGWSA